MLATSSLRLSIAVSCFLLIIASVQSREMSWTGSAGDGDWFTAANWTSNNIPQASDDITLSSGSILLTNQTANLASFSMSGGMLVFSNWNARLEATQINITGGSVSLPPAFANDTVTNRIWFKGGTFTLTTPGTKTINADDGGFRANNGPGPGNYGGGGSHGGVGNDGSAGSGGAVNGVAEDPGPGSGGGGRTQVGGAGGGVVRIEMTGAVTLNGTVSANGQDSDVASGDANAYGGGGSGGGIWISGNTINGDSGVIQANGGYGARFGGSGGGGRIALLFDPVAQEAAAEHHLKLLTSSKVGSYKWPGDIGSLYLSDTAGLNESWLPHTGELVIPGTTWSMNAFYVSNGWLRVDNSSVTLSIMNDIVINGISGHFDFRGAILSCGGDLSLTNGGDFSVYAAATNGSTDYGCLVTVSNETYVGESSWIYPHSHIHNGGSALFRMASLNVASNGGFSANNFGYSGGVTTTGDKKGYGPGRGDGSATTNASGAGYGGRGGRSKDAATRGSIYGDLEPEYPRHAGSGGASIGNAKGRRGGYGGGVVRLEIDGHMALQGTLTVNGQVGLDGGGGGGSGGSIFVKCRSYTAETDATLSANGGNGPTSNGQTAGGGGGGRIALWYGEKMEEGINPDRLMSSQDTGDFAGIVTMAGGDGYALLGDTSETGTFRLIRVMRVKGTIFLLR